MSLKPGVSFQHVTPDTEAVLQSVLERSPEYFRRVEGSEVLPHFARKELESMPSGRGRSYEKIYLLAYLNGTPMGAVDFHKDHPAVGDAYLGLLLLDEEFHGRGLGRRIYESLEAYAKSNFATKRLILGVSEENNVAPFWLKMGFKRNGKTYVWKGEKIETQVFEMEKEL